MTVLQQPGRFRSCLIVLILFVVMGLLITYAREHARQKAQQAFADQRNELFVLVKAGDNGEGSFVFDVQGIKMLANDTDCIANLQVLHLFDVKLIGPEIAAAKRLSNVKTVYFEYCTRSENLLQAMQGMPSVEEIYFHRTPISNDGIALLASLPNLKKVSLEQIVSKEQEALLRTTIPRTEVEIITN